MDRETFAIYHNNNDCTFDDLAITGIATATKFMNGWGLKFLDDDNDALAGYAPGQPAEILHPGADKLIEVGSDIA
jgi:hypothetical protein